AAKAPTRVVALSTVLAVPPRTKNNSTYSSTPPAWDREWVRRAVTPADDAILARLKCSWTRKKLRVLVGALRVAEQRHGPLEHVRIGARVFDRVIGGKLPPATVQPVLGGLGEPLHPRAMLIRRAE